MHLEFIFYFKKAFINELFIKAFIFIINALFYLINAFIIIVNAFTHFFIINLSSSFLLMHFLYCIFVNAWQIKKLLIYLFLSMHLFKCIYFIFLSVKYCIYEMFINAFIFNAFIPFHKGIHFFNAHIILMHVFHFINALK